MPGARVFVDTTAIIASFAVGCWTEVCRRYSVETVEKCIEEACTGDTFGHHRIDVDRDTLIAGLARRYSVSKAELARLVIDYPRCQGLDDGELHLFACLHGKNISPPGSVLISTADKAAVVAASSIGWIDSLVSLEDLARECGVSSTRIDALGRQHRTGWLNEVKVKIRLGVIP